MKLCLPVLKNAGFSSPICAHFGSAPFFLIVDTETLSLKTIPNANQHHAHGMCQPLAVLGKEKFDGIVVGGIGAGALNRLRSAGIAVYKTAFPSLKETVSAYNQGQLPEVTPDMACAHHHGE
ncbi:MAG TPA: NifB/NifX family molybdenum-iron cluster-binding protein [Elusimicrobiota bacterium]|nr:NifB/NifX family molybdenum-iron cluster-binding protein [Elusimicrobiota bacterium]